MKSYRIDLRKIQAREEMQTYISKAIPVPPYYGRNLDALYDVLRDIAEPTAMLVLHDREPAAAVNGAIKTMKDAAHDNPALSVEFWAV